MKKLFAVLSLTLFICAVASPVMATTGDKGKKAKTEQSAEKKEGCSKSASCGEKSDASKATVKK